MPVHPPSDFRPDLGPRLDPSLDELYDAWERSERYRANRDRDREWRRVREDARRTAAGEIVGRDTEVELPSYLRDSSQVGPRTLAALRNSPRTERVAEAGVDTWSPTWSAPDGSPLARALTALATSRRQRAMLLPEPVGQYRVGWFPSPGFAFAEGHPSPDGLESPDYLPDRLAEVEDALQAIGLPVAAASRAGVRRLDATVDLLPDSAAQGLAILTGVAALSLPGGKLQDHRTGRVIESVAMKSRSGKIIGRVYDKGVESGRAPRGRLIRSEDQRRYAKALRRDAEELTSPYVRDQYRRRMMPLWSAAQGIRVRSPLTLAETLVGFIESGQLTPSRARSLAGYLLLDAAGASHGARRTRYQLERDCRELGLVLGDAALEEVEVDLGAILEECLEADAWTRRA